MYFGFVKSNTFPKHLHTEDNRVDKANIEINGSSVNVRQQLLTLFEPEADGFRESDAGQVTQRILTLGQLEGHRVLLVGQEPHWAGQGDLLRHVEERHDSGHLGLVDEIALGVVQCHQHIFPVVVDQSVAHDVVCRARYPGEHLEPRHQHTTVSSHVSSELQTNGGRNRYRRFWCC